MEHYEGLFVVATNFLICSLKPKIASNMIEFFLYLMKSP